MSTEETGFTPDPDAELPLDLPPREEPALYRPRQVALEARQVCSPLGRETAAWCGSTYDDVLHQITVQAYQGPVVARSGDWIVKGTHAFMVYGDDAFRKTYEPVTEAGPFGAPTPDGSGHSATGAEPPPAGKLARVEVKGFRDLGVVRVTETTFAGEAMVHAERTPWSSPDFEGDAADFPASSLHFVTWLPERTLQPAVQVPAAITTGGDPWGRDADEPDDWDERNPF